jgi:hypothetical protein
MTRWPSSIDERWPGKYRQDGLPDPVLRRDAVRPGKSNSFRWKACPAERVLTGMIPAQVFDTGAYNRRTERLTVGASLSVFDGRGVVRQGTRLGTGLSAAGLSAAGLCGTGLPACSRTAGRQRLIGRIPDILNAAGKVGQQTQADERHKSHQKAVLCQILPIVVLVKG